MKQLLVRQSVHAGVFRSRVFGSTASDLNKHPVALHRKSPAFAFKGWYRSPCRRLHPNSKTLCRPANCMADQKTGNKHSLVNGLEELDRKLSLDKGTGELEALKLARQLQNDGVLRGFGGAQQVPKRLYSLEELRINKIDAEQLLSPKDFTLDRVRLLLQASLLAGLMALYFTFELDISQLLGLVLGIAFFSVLDQVVNGGGFEALALDTAGRVINSSYADRVALHESGHFLIAYLLGWLPKQYTLSSLDAWQRYGALNVQAGTQFCDQEFEREVAGGTLSSSSLDGYTCIALAGVATEYLRYGRAEGGLGDVAQLDGMLKALRFTQKKADGEIRWAVLNVITLLRRHTKTHDALAAAMKRGDSVASCIRLLEQSLSDANI